ncbi:hypothetical protein FB451DRAFT_986832, partial [Mycena latifolia]
PHTGARSGRLKGEYTWPFSIPLPATAASKGKSFELPHTFVERGANFSIQYSLELRILRGKLMHGKQKKDKLGCTFGFFSMRQPGPPSMLRQLAYQENSPLLIPEADPEVWQSLPSFSNSGLLFSVLKLDVKCMVSCWASDLCYTRSTSIPCALTIETANTHALDVLTSPTAALERRTRSPGGADTLELCGQAVFKASTEGAAVDASSRCRLMGEIHLRRTLQPSTDVIDFLIEYTVLVLPFQVTGFKPHRYEALLRQKAGIVTKYASGPRARTYTPATYETRNTATDEY